MVLSFMVLGVYNNCHGLLKMYVNLSDIAILNIKEFDDCCINKLIRLKMPQLN